MSKINGYLTEFNVNLLTDSAKVTQGATDYPFRLSSGRVDGITFEWGIDWGSFLPSDFPSNSAFHVTHRFIPANPNLMAVVSATLSGAVGTNGCARSIFFTCNLASRSIVTLNTPTTPALTTVPTCQIRPGYLNTLYSKSMSLGSTRTGVTFTPTPVGTYDITQTMFANYGTDSNTITVYSPESCRTISIQTWETCDYLGTEAQMNAQNYPPIQGIHQFLFKLVR